MKRTTRTTIITFKHAAWDAPKIQTQDWCRHDRSEQWPGHDLSGGSVRCVPAPHFDAIVAEAQRVGWPLAYRRDLFVCDRRFLARVPADVPFVFMLRECGTCLYLATTDRIDDYHYAWDAPRFVSKTFGADRVRYYTWDGSRLREHRTPETAAEATRAVANAYGKTFDVCRRTPIARCERGSVARILAGVREERAYA